ncbi:glutaredoxin 3 [Solimonas marina]|uniref:Glutaredoxin n=1 Tax=Solimonas marina TaxID=2714601 RepID=A0A969W6B2_9GAMM|nr:glutaredoxin 3 [Solimonas marina]NKF20699.1 glutaredoxin 3 [Solimonas marina]
MKRVLMYTTRVCPYCVMAKRLLDIKGVAVQEVRIDEDAARRDEMMRLTGRRTVPQIFVGETHVGGCDDLHALERAGKLDALLQDESS